MSHGLHHEHLIKELADHLEPVLSKSPQAIYIYLDDTHKICNQKFADLLEYKSTQEWVDNQSAIENILEDDQPRVIEAYTQAYEHYIASHVSATALTQSGKKIKVEALMVPITYKGETFVIHFLTNQTDL